jgi:hypothetical protein
MTRYSSRMHENVGARLHNQAIVYRMQKERLTAQIKEEQEQKLMEGVSFKPTLVAKRQTKKDEEAFASHEERSFHHARLREERVQARRLELEQEELQECQNFRPKINKKSAMMNQQKIA